MWLKTSCELEFNIEIPTPFILMLRPRSGKHQWVASESYEISPTIPVFEYADSYGNLCQRLIAPPGLFNISTSSIINTKGFLDQEPGAPFIEVQNLPDAVLHYLTPSRYVESDKFGSLALDIVGESIPGYDQVEKIESYLRENIAYVPGSSECALSAMEILDQQHGVCRDLAHLGIALCRSLSIPARMVVGYLHELTPMDMHAWFEAYVGGRWFTFDATQPAGRKGGYVAVGFGRDATDVAIYNQFGPPVFAHKQEVSVEHLQDRD
ncbi:MAG: transglutaminase family protein [Cyclobacteriaceae bacterium]